MLSFLFWQLESVAWSLSPRAEPLPSAQSTNQILVGLRQDLEKSGNLSDAAYDKLAKIIESQPKNASAHLLLGRCYGALALPELADEQYKLALQCGLKDPKEVVELIKALARSGHLEEANDLVRQAAQRFPKDPEILYWVGNFFASHNQTKQAEAAYNEALQRKSPVAGLASALASIRLTQQRYDEALALAQLDLKIDQQSLLANQVTGLTLIKLGRYSQAVLPLSIAFQRAPTQSVISGTYARLLYWQGDYLKALSPALINLASTSANYRDNLASKQLLVEIVRHLKRPELTAAIDDIAKKYRIRSTAAFYGSLADVLSRCGFDDLAIEQYHQAVQVNPGFAETWFKLALLLITAQGNYKEALYCFKQAAALAPADEKISKYLWHLEDRLSTYNSDWAWQAKDWLRHLR